VISFQKSERVGVAINSFPCRPCKAVLEIATSPVQPHLTSRTQGVPIESHAQINARVEFEGSDSRHGPD
jgi:hypothetical protein